MAIYLSLLLCFPAVGGASDEPSAKDILQTALDRAWEQDDPRELVMRILSVKARIDSHSIVEQCGIASRRIAGRMRIEPSREIAQAVLARIVAPHDRELRDEILRRAVDDARQALSDDSLWHAQPLPPRVLAFSEPVRMRAKEREMLALELRLWQCIVAYPNDRKSTQTALDRMFVDAKGAGDFGGCTRYPLEKKLTREFANLDAQLLLVSAKDHWPDRELAHRCAEVAVNRWNDALRDRAITATLIVYAVEHGACRRDHFEVFSHYDPHRAWELATTEHFPSRDRDAIHCDVITDLAWIDPDFALDAAAKETEPYLRRSLVQNVSRVWAYKRPETIEFALRHQDNAARSGWARETAAEELAWRKAGNPPRNTRDKAPRKFDYAPAQITEPLVRDPRSSNAEEVRVLEHLADTSWLIHDHRSMYLCQAGAISYRETLTLSGIDELTSGLDNVGERDAVLRYCAQQVATWGDPRDAVKLLERIASPWYFTDASCKVAEKLAERSGQR